jgi:uncharacterized membrane protein (UPF0127 family)
MQNLPRAKLVAGNGEIDVFIARSAEDRSLGLMHRRDMPYDQGMLFVCDEPAIQKFWMKDTPLPLSVAYIEEDGTIASIHDMRPETLESHSSGKPVRYILEMNQGWFDDNGVEPGMRLAGPMFVLATADQG